MSDSDEARRSAEAMETRCAELSAELRAAVQKVSDARAEALFETAAEVIDGLAKAMRHYRGAREAAWRDS